MYKIDYKNLIFFSVRVFVVFLVGLAVWRLAWINDDAFITLRTLLNFTHGIGAGFNFSENVQAYTHPLWFLLWFVVGWISNEWIFSIILVSIALTMAATALIVFQVSNIFRLVLLSLVLLASNAFIEYATSGLENSLGYFLIGLALFFCLRITSYSSIVENKKYVFLGPLSIGLLFSLIFLTRMDYILFVLPPLLYIVWVWRSSLSKIFFMLSGFAFIVLLWFSWSFATYSSILPNTFLAKRNVDIPVSELVSQGLNYFLVSVKYDFLTVAVIIVALVLSLFNRNMMIRSWGVGLFSYLVYIVWIGGDFMAGRFLSVPVYVAVFLLAVTDYKEVSLPYNTLGNKTNSLSPTYSVAATILLSVAIALLFYQVPSVFSNPKEQRWEFNENYGIADERGFYVQYGDRYLANLASKGNTNDSELNFVTPENSQYVEFSLADIDYLTKKWGNPSIPDKPSTVIFACGGAGTLGIVSGPAVHIVDTCGLSDRFLAGKTFVSEGKGTWRQGHFNREIPEGYEDALKNNDPTKLVDREDRATLVELWKKIR